MKTWGERRKSKARLVVLSLPTGPALIPEALPLPCSGDLPRHLQEACGPLPLCTLGAPSAWCTLLHSFLFSQGVASLWKPFLTQMELSPSFCVPHCPYPYTSFFCRL